MAVTRTRGGWYSNLTGRVYRTQDEANAGETAFYQTDAGKALLKKESDISMLTQQILDQGTSGKWSGQGFGSTEANARAMARMLADGGITRLEDFGKRTVEGEELFFGDEGLEYRKAQLPEFYNKKTGQALSGGDYRAENETTFGRTYAGKGSTTFNVHFNEMGMPIFYTQYGGSSSDWGAIAPLLAVASFVPGVAPFAMAASAVGNAYNGNMVGAVLSALGAANAFGAQYSAVNPTAANYVNGLDVASDIAAGVSSASVVTTAANWLAANAGNIRTAQQAVGLLNALDKRNVAGIVDALVNIAPQVGVTIPSDFVKPINIAAMASAASKGDWAGALNAAQLLTTNPALRQDIKLAEKATNFANAIKTGNPASMMTTFMDLAKHQNLGTGTVQLASKNLGMPMSTATANKMLESGDMDQQVKDYYALVNKVSKSYEENFNQPVTPEMLAGFAENGGILEGYNAYVQDKRSTHPDELVDLLKKAGLKTSDLSDEQTLKIYGMSEIAAESYLQNLSDIKEFTYDGSKAGSKEAAAAEAIKNGYNTFKAPDGQTYTTMPGSVASKLVKDAATGKNVGIDTKSLETINGIPLRDIYDERDIPEIVITATKLDKPLPTDAEAWKAYQDELKSLGGASFTKKFTDQLDILTAAFKDTKPDTMQDVLKNVLAYGSRSFGGLASTLLTGAQAVGLSKDSAALKVADAIERWGKTNQSSGIIDAEGAFSKAINGITKESIAAKLGTTPDKISDFQVAREQLKELGSQMVKNPKGTFSVGLVEGLQEIPFLAASGGIGSVAAKMMGKAAGFAVARGSDAALNGFESFSGNYAEVKEYLVKNGYSESKAEAKAIASGLESMGVTMLTSWVGDKAILKSFMGDITKDSVANIAGAGAKEYVMGYVEGGLQNASAQIAKYGEIRNMAEVTAAGTLEGFVQSGLTTGTLSADKLSQVVARDYDGRGVTLGSILDGNSTFDPSSLNSNFELTAGFNIGDAVKYQQVFNSDPNVTPTEYMKTAEFFRSEGLNSFTVDDIKKVTGSDQDLTGDALRSRVSSFVDPLVVREDEARRELTNLGYVDPTQEEVNAFVGQRDQASTFESLRSQYDPLATTPDEAQQMMRDLGYTNLTDAEAQALAGKIKEEEARANVKAYVDPRMVTREEAEQFYRNIGFNPTEEDITQFIRQGQNVNQDAVQAEVSTYVDPRMVDEQEVRDALAVLGFNDATDSMVRSLTGQYAEAKLAGLTKENVPGFIYETIKGQIKDLSKQTTDLGEDLNKRVDELVSQGKTQYEATQQAIAEVNQQNQELQAKVGTQGRAVNQSDIDALTQMLGGQRSVDLAYDVTGDKQITQDDINLLQNLITNNQTQWTAPAGSPWAATGLYGDIAAAEAQRKADFAAMEKQRQADIAAQQAAAKEAERRSAIRTAAGTAQTQLGQLMQSAPGAYKALQQTTTPIYAGEMQDFSLSSPLDVGFFDLRKEAQGGQKQQQTTKIATGGYLDDLLDLLR